MSKENSNTAATTAHVDPLFLQAEHISVDFSLFPGKEAVPLSDYLHGLVDQRRIKSRLKAIQKLSVDDYIDQTVLPAQHSKRPGAKEIIAGLNGRIISSKEQGPFYTAEVELVTPRGPRRMGFVCQERGAANGSWLPEHHELARQAMRDYADMSRPIIFFIDTPGADAGEVANANNQAHSISRLITESTNLDVPTVGIVIGVGYSGGAIPLAAANVLLSVRDGIFNTIQPQGLQSIARKFNLSWQECAKAVGVSPEELVELGCLDGIIDYSPTDRDERQHNLQRAILSSVDAIENAALEFTRGSDALKEHYQRHLERALNPAEHEVTLKTGNSHDLNLDLGINRPITTASNIFGLAFRYLRYLSLRNRIHSISSSEYGRLSKLTLPEGDLDSRLSAEKESIFKQWFNDPDKVIYDDTLVKVWKNFSSKRDELGTDRNAVTRLILGDPQENYNKALKELTFEIGFSLYNRWKTSAAHNLQTLITLLKDESSLPVSTGWPEKKRLTVIDVVAHQEVRATFIEQCEDILIFDALYDNVVANLASIAKEAMDNQSLSRSAVEELLKKSLNKVLAGKDDSNSSAQFEQWLKLFLAHRGLGEMMQKVEQWKSIGYPQMNDSLFVILTYYFEKLLPAYYKSSGEGDFKGAINPARIGRRKDFWNRLTMGYRDLLIAQLLRAEKAVNKVSPEEMIGKFFSDFTELDADRTSPNPVNFPGFRQSIEQALEKGIRPCGLVTGFATLNDGNGNKRRVGVAASNMLFQAGAFDMASGEKFCHLLVECAKHKLPVVCFISSGGMQTKEGASALFSMAVVNDRITRFIRDNELPVIMFGYGDCTGGAQASFVTHPLVQTYYFSGTNMPFAGQMVVPAYLPSTSTLSNYLSKVPGAMAELVQHPFSPELDGKLKEIDSAMPVPSKSVTEVIGTAVASVLPVLAEEGESVAEVDPRSLMKPLDRVLVHARGCTAVKLIRKAQEADLKVVLVASDPDMESVPAKMLRDEQDTLVCLGGNTSDESYLNAHSVLKVAEIEKVPALHPGIGFLSENPHFASLCVNNGINFVGPSASSMMTMGNKSNAIQTVQSQNVPVVPGSHGILSSCEQAINIANEIGYPVLLKAVHGGGGKGIQVVRSQEEMLKYYGMISTEAKAAFGNGDLYLEKFVTSMRHIEVQLIRDSHGNGRVLGIRDCSVQRNNQKVVEESGSTMLSDELKEKAFNYTLAIADAVDYTGAGTVEFIYDLQANAIYFMEMNTRLQVEHPVTEATSGVDIVKTQFEIAGGASIEHIEREEKGYAIEVRVTAEKIVVDSDGVLQLVPNPGVITKCVMPEHKDVELISIADTGIEISPFYDSLIAQIIMRGKDRADTVKKLYKYLDSVVIEGIATNITLLKRILKDKTFNGGEYDTNYLPGFLSKLDAQALIDETNAAASSGAAGPDSESIKVAGSNELKVYAASSGVFYTAASPTDPDFVKVGDVVSADQTLALMEAMKMFSQVSLSSFNSGDNILYPTDQKYRIERINNSNGQQVAKDDLLFIVSVVED